MAYAVAVRSPVTLQIDGARVLAADAEELLLQWDVGYADGRLQLQLEVRWRGTGLPALVR